MSQKQKCFLCEGDGQIYPYENKGGIGEECPACKGFKEIDAFLIRCPKCGGNGKQYDTYDKKGISDDCCLCNAKGYVDGVCIKCKK